MILLTRDDGGTASRRLGRILVLFLVALLGCAATTAATSSDSGEVIVETTTAQRVQEHNDFILSTLNVTTRGTYAQVVLTYAQAFPLDERPLQALLNQVGANNSNSDFAIVILVRILCLLDQAVANATTTNATTTSNTATDIRYWQQVYTARILPVLQTERYWYTTDTLNDDTMNSENHMILWMSSSWILQQKYPTFDWRDDATQLRKRLVHYLKLKATYGFYEFLSITYMPFTFGGLLNLVDYYRNNNNNTDVEVANWADLALRRLVADYLLFVNDKGIHFTVAGRDYAERFLEAPYTQPMDGIVYLLTGLGTLHPLGTDGFSCFLSTSSIDFTPQVSQWQSTLETTYTYGHTLVESFAINKALDRYDRTVFQFSQGTTHCIVLVVFMLYFGTHIGTFLMS
jgi:uncharacterized protein YcfL